MTPLKVTAHLAGPLAGDAPMLDAILERVMVRHLPAILRTEHGHRHASTMAGRYNEPAARPGMVPIPLKRETIGGWLVPRCSSPILPPSPDAPERVEHYAKRLSVEHAADLDPRDLKIVNTTGGEFKSYRLPLRVRAVARVAWFCVGRGTEVRRRLKDIAAIGKKTSMGYGRVARWEVERVAEDWSWFAPSSKGPVLMRPLPAGEHLPVGLQGARPWFGSCVPPYWQRSFFLEVVTPC